jgi:hypothetical protein
VLTRPDLRHLLGGNQFFIDLAGYARTHPGTALELWRPASAFHSAISLFHDRDALPVAAVNGVRLPRPDGAGVWRQEERAVPFFLEYDTGTERLDILTDKIFKYDTLATAIEWLWPALFVLPSQRREDNLHHAIHDHRRALKALWYTTNSELLHTNYGGPAGPVWRPGGPPHLPAGTVRLIDLAYLDPEHDQRYQVANPLHARPNLK